LILAMSATASLRRPIPFWALPVALALGAVAAFAASAGFQSPNPSQSAGALSSALDPSRLLSGAPLYIVIAIVTLAGLVLAAVLASKLMASAKTEQPSVSKAANSASVQLSAELATVLATIRSRVATHDSYAKSLGGAQDRLDALPTPDQVRVIVSLLVAENHRMRLDTESMGRELNASRTRIEALRTSLETAREAGLRDPLTGVGNRRCFDLKLNDAIRTAAATSKPLAIIIGDLDGFKKVNDDFGHQIGDEVLKYFSQLLSSNIREADTVTRYGGEEFAIILPETETGEAAQFAERIREQLGSKHLTIRKTSREIGKVTASFGVAALRPGETADSLVSRADEKLYEAKKAGRNRVGTA
jgi:diguanylate cyclase